MLPSNFSFCMYTNIGSNSSAIEPFQQVHLPNTSDAVSNYLYNTPDSDSYNGQFLPAVADIMQLFISQDSTNMFYLNVIIDSPTDNTGGNVTMLFSYGGPTANPLIVVQDDPSKFTGSNNLDYPDQ